MKYDEKYVKGLLPKRAQVSHKGTFGHVLNIAGSGFYIGAAGFSSLSSIVVGAGRCTLASTLRVIRAVASRFPDIILFPLDETKEYSIAEKALEGLFPRLTDYNVISIGSGLSLNKNTEKFFNKIVKYMKDSETPFVIDADGLTFLAKRKKISLPHKTVLTPHPAEMSRLLGVPLKNIMKNKELWAVECAKKYDCTVVFKTNRTVVADCYEKVYVNNTGNSALAKGGTGDVLTGTITGFLAQGLTPFEASCLAVYINGLAAELASEDLTEYSVLASDLIKYLPKAIKKIAD